MHSALFYVNPTPLIFAGLQAKLDETMFVVFGVPFDSTSTYRPGARFAPSAIRDASINLETWSFRANVDFEDVKAHDLGDVVVAHGNVEETLRRVQEVIADIYAAGKIPIMLGGEHTITLGALKAKRDVAVLVFDAHLDMRDEYLAMKVSHATVGRRIVELVGSIKTLFIGVRAMCREEYDYVNRKGIFYVTSHDIARKGVREVSRAIKDKLAGFDSVYVSVDVDVLDPAYAPGVSNPEPEGLSMSTLLDLLNEIVDKRVVGVDIVEVTPGYDGGLAAIQAAKIAYETMCLIYRARKA